MQIIEGRLVHSASDLNDYLQCRRLTQLEALVARGKLTAPTVDDPRGDLIRKKGIEHEERHLERLREVHGTEGVVAFERAQNTFEALYVPSGRRATRWRRAFRFSIKRRFSTAHSSGTRTFCTVWSGRHNSVRGATEVLDTEVGARLEAIRSRPAL